jgi:hypothetical protein
MPVTRNTSGFATVAADNPLGMLPYPDPTTWCVWQENFIITPNTSLGWTLTQTNCTLAQAGVGPCGGITLTCAGADNDLGQLYPTLAQFTLVSGKKAIFEVKCKVDKGSGGTIGEQELFLGLAAVETGANFMASDGLSMASTNCIGFVSYDGSVNYNAIVRKADVESADAAVATCVDVTDIVLGWYFDGTSIVFYVNDTVVAHLYDFPTAAMTPMFFIKAGEAKAAVLTAYYMTLARER